MRHRVPGNRLSRPKDQQDAMLRSLATELLRHDEITTTLAKAKALRSRVEQIITLAKTGQVTDYQKVLEKARNGSGTERDEARAMLSKSLNCRRQVSAVLMDRYHPQKLKASQSALNGLVRKSVKEKDPKAFKLAIKKVMNDPDALRKVVGEDNIYRKLVFRNGDVVEKVFTQVAPRYRDRPGGYTRIIRAGFRRGDAAPMAIIQLV